MAAVSGLVLFRRYRWLRKVLSQGTSIKGIVELSDRHDSNMHSDSASSMQTSPTYVYYITVHYTMQGTERKIRQRLPFSPGTYRIKQGGEIDLLVLEDEPQNPLISEVYLNPPPMRKNPWLRL